MRETIGDMPDFPDPEALQEAAEAELWSADVVTVPAEVRTHTGQMMVAVLIMAEGYVLDAPIEPAPSPEPESVSALLEQGLRRVAEKVGNWPPVVVVRHSEVAAHLGTRLDYLSIEVEYSPILPEIEEATASLRSYMGSERHPQIHFGPGFWRGWYCPEAWIADFFQAAARYYEAAPWTRYPFDAMLAVEGTSGRTWYVLVEGDPQETDPVPPVLSLFSERADAERVATIGSMEEARFVGRGLILLFADRTELPSQTVQEIRQAGWPVASSDAWPALLMINTPAGGLTAADAGDLLAVMHVISGAVPVPTPDSPAIPAGEWQDPESGLGLRVLPLPLPEEEEEDEEGEGEERLEELFAGEAADQSAGLVDRFDHSSLVEQIQKRVEAEGAATLEDVQRIAAQEHEAYNRASQEELGGLSPEQTARLLYQSWESPDSIVRFDTDLPLAELETSPFLYRTRILLGTMLERGGIAPTQAGNLPRAFVQDMMEAMDTPLTGPDRSLRDNRRYNEADTHLYDLRLFLEFAGCIRRYRKKFIVARAVRPLLKPEQAGVLFRHLFIKHFQYLDLSCLDCYAPAHLFQSGVAYSLWKFLDSSVEWLPAEAFSDRLILPTLRDDLLRSVESEKELQAIITFRLMQPLERFGLAENREMAESRNWYPWNREYRPTPLAARFLHFDFSDQESD